ncbi:hypothetical protein [Streptococcus pacificus]|uniref:ABC transporter permease n=1 Tax=Streptococcus pacificus TaxID=2740577 RepID=A0ABS0ZKJ0_9STRE|nr:hypothetical protein [Streptococcus pacificus]MBJ8326484.1 hypothetical protein [Streptococcus pacificus]
MVKYTLVFLLINVIIEMFLTKVFYKIKLSMYQGFTTRFFSQTEEKISIHSIIFFIFLTPILNLLGYIFSVRLNYIIGQNIILYDLLFLQTPLFWLTIFAIVIIFERIKLVNIPFILGILLLSSIINWYISQMYYTGYISALYPDKSDTFFQIYTMVFLFIVSFLKLLYDNDNYDDKRQHYIKEKLIEFDKKFSILSNLNILNSGALYIVLAILIKENFERPRLVRVYEKLKNTKTRNIAQNDSKDDYDSVDKLISFVGKRTNLQNSDLDSTIIYKIAREYNDSNSYAQDIIFLYRKVKVILENENI